MPVTSARASWAVIALATLIAIVGARPYAGGWNDGSRLATVESLIERGTLAIEESKYCRPDRSPVPPYDPTSATLNTEGTKDKLFIAGHYYSDKPAVISLLMAGPYRAGMALGWPRPSERPELFCMILTIATGAGALLLALLCIYSLGRRVGLGGWALPAWLASFAFATFALAYTRHVNNHVMHLAILSAICLFAVQLAQDGVSTLRLVALGTLTGLGFNLDLGSGPLLVPAVFGLVAWRTRCALPVAVCALAALPWGLAGLAINYALGGVVKPINMVPEYMAWPGSPFTTENLTGFWRPSLRSFIYPLALLFGKHGLLNHNLTLLLAIPGIVALRRCRSLRPELVFLLGWCAASWAMYALLSNNYGGACCSIRWFVPFLAPLYLLLALYLKQSPERLSDFLVLSAWGALLGAVMWWTGPWTSSRIPFLWPISGGALASWLVLAWRRSRTVSRFPWLVVRRAGRQYSVLSTEYRVQQLSINNEG